MIKHSFVIEGTHVAVGVSVIVRRDGKVLMGLRKGAHEANSWAFPGGKMDTGETVAGAGSRELYEETGIDISPDNLRKLTYTNDYFKREGLHFITLYLETEWNGQEPRIMEPEKCAEWVWAANPPGTLFLPIRNLLNEEPHIIWPP